MKKVYNYWMPDSDNHFERLIAKRVRNGGPPEYQDDVRDAAYKHVSNFDLAIDVGANVGLWSVPLSKKFKNVIAFEPIDHVYKCLDKNKTHNIDVRKYALGSVNSKIHMVFDAENTGASFVDTDSLGVGNIEIKRLDDLNLPKFDLLKIDCERHELEVIKGGIETILKYKPVIIVEQQPDTEYCAGHFLKSLGATEIDKVRKDYIFTWN